MTSTSENVAESRIAVTEPPRLADPIPRRRFTPSSAGFLVMVAVCIGLTATIVFADISRLTVGVLVVPLTILLLICGVHVSVAMAFGGALGLWKLGGWSGLGSALSTIPYSSAASWSLTVTPMFVLMGIVLGQTGITGQLFDAARLWLGRMRGGLAVATVASGAGLAAASGSTTGISYAMGRVAIPEMLRSRYSPQLATGVVTAAGTLGQIIPPSVLLVIYAGIAQTPVGPQLLAGVVPGVLLAVLFAVMIMVRARIDPDLAPATHTAAVPWGVRLRSLASIWPLPVLILVIIGGMYSGFMTATEAGAVGALVAILIGVWSKRRAGARAVFAVLGRSLAETASAVAMIMFLLIGVHILSRLVALSGLAQAASRMVTALDLTPIALLLTLVVTYLVLGMFMDTLAMLMLTIPVLLPVLEALGIDLVWFGIFAVLMAEIAMITPPVGVVAFIVHGLAQDREVNLGTAISLATVFRGCVWFVATALALVVLLILFPDLALWLPSSGSAQ
jgi:TRAP-type C4-dicarboxylate transport system, large permease component